MLGTFFEEQARGLMNKGHQVGIFNVEFKPFSYNEPLIQQEFLDNGLVTYQYYYKGVFPKLTRINYWLFCKNAYIKFKEYVDKYGKPNILHAHSVFWGGIVAMYISKKTGIPYVITEHLTNYVSGTIIDKVDISCAKKVFYNSYKNIVVSSTFKNELSKKLDIPSDRFIVIYNMVADLFFYKNLKKKINDSEPIIFFTNSFIHERKNHKLLIESFHVFSKNHENSKLIIGGGAIGSHCQNLKEELVKLCEDLKIDDKVSFLGNISREQVKSNLDNCHVFLLASKYETFGVVLIEALAAGKPVVSTNSKGPEDIVTKANGILVNSWNVDDFSYSMEKIIQDYDMYNQEEISKNCADKFGENNIIEQLVVLYEKAIGN
jgi:glycosyltransferase involved in cell wall biosynthesis